MRLVYLTADTFNELMVLPQSYGVELVLPYSFTVHFICYMNCRPYVNITEWKCKEIRINPFEILNQIIQNYVKFICLHFIAYNVNNISIWNWREWTIVIEYLKKFTMSLVICSNTTKCEIHNKNAWDWIGDDNAKVDLLNRKLSFYLFCNPLPNLLSLCLFNLLQ